MPNPSSGRSSSSIRVERNPPPPPREGFSSEEDPKLLWRSQCGCGMQGFRFSHWMFNPVVSGLLLQVEIIRLVLPKVLYSFSDSSHSLLMHAHFCFQFFLKFLLTHLQQKKVNCKYLFISPTDGELFGVHVLCSDCLILISSLYYLAKVWKKNCVVGNAA